MKALFQQIEDLIPKLHGWCSVEKGHALAASVIALRPETSVVIGVWGGRDTFALALAHKHIGRGFVTAIDPWSPMASADGQTGSNYEWWGKQADHESVYNDFTKHLFELELNQIVKVVRSPSDHVTPPEKVGILSLDGNHGPQAEKDANRFCPQILQGGLVFLDDLFWEGGHVLKAATNMRTNGFRELYRVGTGAVFQR